MIESLTATSAHWTVGIVRVVLGLVFFAHGAQKMLGWYEGPVSSGACAPSPKICISRRPCLFL